MSHPNATRRLALTAAPFLLAAAACAPTREPAPMPAASAPPTVADDTTAGHCDAAAAEQFVGQSLDASLEARARAAAGARSVRVIRPGMAVTMDYRHDRLNIELDDAGRIVRVHCG